MLENILNIKGELVFCPYHWKDKLKQLSWSGTNKGWKDYQGIIHKTYHGEYIETHNHVIWLMTEVVAKHFDLPTLTAPGPGNLRGFMYNDIKEINKIVLNGFGVKNVNLDMYLWFWKMMVLTEDCTILNCVSPRSQKVMNPKYTPIVIVTGVNQHYNVCSQGYLGGKLRKNELPMYW